MSDKRLCEGGYELPSRGRSCDICGARPKDRCRKPLPDPRDAQIADLQSRIAAAEADAERYRYLRSRDDDSAVVGCWAESNGVAVTWLNGEELDDAIDAARGAGDE